MVDPAASDLLAEKVSGPVERVTLERSYHVATVDYDAELIQSEPSSSPGRSRRSARQRQTEKPLIASPISFTPMMTRITAMIAALWRAIQPSRSARISFALSPITK